MPTLDVILPIGISFYTFEAINYMVDVYRGRLRAERNFADFLLFILFFPHLVAGPIVRARDFLPQIKRRKRWDWARLHLGAQLFLLGLLKKFVVADRMAQFADPVFADPLHFRTGAAWIAAFAYALQVYCDFSGYSDMAIGTAHMLGYRLTQNFDVPYLAPNITQLWGRWHMSLSGWLHDYVFTPLGGARQGEWKTRRNVLLTFLACGLWHGANWTFVGFGLAHGLMLVFHRAFRTWCRSRPWLHRALQSAPGTVGRVAFTFFCWTLASVLFRAKTFALAAGLYTRLLVPHGPDASGLPLPEIGFWATAALILACHLLARADAWKGLSPRLASGALGVGYAAALTLALLLAPDGAPPFIYFQF
jgi:alginate O-acetyltransferase complex protein AlgI